MSRELVFPSGSQSLPKSQSLVIIQVDGNENVIDDEITAPAHGRKTVQGSGSEPALRSLKLKFKSCLQLYDYDDEISDYGVV